MLTREMRNDYEFVLDICMSVFVCFLGKANTENKYVVSGKIVNEWLENLFVKYFPYSNNTRSN